MSRLPVSVLRHIWSTDTLRKGLKVKSGGEVQQWFAKNQHLDDFLKLDDDIANQIELYRKFAIQELNRLVSTQLHLPPPPPPPPQTLKIRELSQYEDEDCLMLEESPRHYKRKRS